MADVVAEAVRTLRAGGLVAFPTETVYGLGADARNPRAVARIFEVKGRPAGHPLIVHVAAVDDARAWAGRWTPEAERLAAAFWPGPLTLVVPKAADVSELVTGGQETVGLRVPNHPLARELLTAFGGGLAAPSANRFGSVSPTTAAHVALELGDSVDLILDGGPCRVGIESTIVDLSGERPALLRPGGVPVDRIEPVLGRPLAPAAATTARAPGTLASHYAPRARVTVAAAENLERVVAEAALPEERVVVLAPEPVPGASHIPFSQEVEAAARHLYAALREVDDRGFELAVVALPPARGLGVAVADRLRRAAAPRPSSREPEPEGT